MENTIIYEGGQGNYIAKLYGYWSENQNAVGTLEYAEVDTNKIIKTEEVNDTVQNIDLMVYSQLEKYLNQI
jgi:hypothetical protein